VCSAVLGCSCSGVVQLTASLDREKQEVYQLRVIAFDKATRQHDRPVAVAPSYFLRVDIIAMSCRDHVIL